MINLKTQFEIRYTPLLDFNPVYKSIVAPYLKLCDFTLDGTATYDEKIVLHFKKEKYQIDIRWDRIICVAEGPRADLRKTQGPLFAFFDILDKLRLSPSFGILNNCVLSEVNFKEGGGKTFQEVKENFKEKYLKSESYINVEGFEDDCGVTLSYFYPPSKTLKIAYGPFNPEKDYSEMKLLPISKVFPLDYQEKHGLVLDCLYIESTQGADIELYRRFSNFISNNTERITL